MRSRAHQIYLWAVLDRSGKLWESLKRRYPRFAWRIESSLSQMKCPVCGRTVKPWFVMVRHLTEGKCGYILGTVVEALARKAGEEELLKLLEGS